jgi:hypothetical protein
MLIKITLLVLAFAFVCSSAQAQEKRAEVAISYTALNLDATDHVEKGIGGRMTVNIKKYIAIDGEITFFPEDSFGNSSTDQFLLGLVGVKSGISNRRLGLFAKARAGTFDSPSLRSGNGLCTPDPRTGVCRNDGRGDHRFALDLGGVVEVYTPGSTTLRMDFGDTMIRFKNDFYFALPEPLIVRDGFHHNFQFSVSFGYRF